MHVVELSENDGVDIYEMLQRIGSKEGAFSNEVYGMSFSEYKQWLKKQANWANGIGLPEGYVIQWTYWLYDDNKPIGYGKLRQRVTEASRRFGGNIGFAIDSACRGRGYGTWFFAELMNIGRKKGINEFISTVEKDNFPSKIIHEKNGGIIIEENVERWIFSF